MKRQKVVKKKIENIDRLAPNAFAPTVRGKKNRLEIIANTTDKEATAKDGRSGIKGYKFSKDNGSSWTGLITEGKYAYENLQSGTTYPIKVKAVDNAGNEEEAQEITGTTEAIPGGNNNIYFNYSPSNWTNRNVTVTITATTEKYQLQYSKDGKIWNNYDSQAKVEMTENGPIYARLTDGVNYGATATGNVSNIDRILPTGSGTVSMESQSAKKATIKINAIDNESGIASITNKTTEFIAKENDTTYKVTKTEYMNLISKIKQEI